MKPRGQSTHSMGTSSVLEGGSPDRVPSCFSNFRNKFLRSPFRSAGTLGISLISDQGTLSAPTTSSLEGGGQLAPSRSVGSTRRLSYSSSSSSSSSPHSKSLGLDTKPTAGILRISTAKRACQPMRTPKSSRSKHTTTAIPDPVFTLFAFLARQGVHVTDLFRRPGNITQMKAISSQLAVGEPVDWSIYNIYTVANVAKRFLLSVPGGLLGEHNERRLLATAVSYSLTEQGQRKEEEETPKQGHMQSHHRNHQHHHHHHHLRTSAGVGEGALPVPSKLMHAPGFRPIDSVAGGHLWISPSFSDTSGFLTDFGLGPPMPFEQTQMDVFVGILDSLPKASRELVVFIFGILHSMVRHASALFSTGCHSCSSSLDLHGGSTGDLGGLDTVTRAPASGTSNPPVCTLAEAVSKSIVGALVHTCPLSVEMVDRASQVLQTLLLRYSLLGDSATSFYTDFMLGRVQPNSASNDRPLPMASIVSQFIIPRAPTRKLRDRKKGSVTRVAELATVTSRLFHFAGGFGGGKFRRHLWRTGDGDAAIPDVSKTSTNCSSLSSVSPMPSPQQTLVQPIVCGPTLVPTESPATQSTLSVPIKSSPKLPQRPQMPVTASVEAPTRIPDQPVGPVEEVCSFSETGKSLYTPVLVKSSSRCSYNRYRAVHRRQLDAMLRRTAWFLDSNTYPQSTSSGPIGDCEVRHGTNPQVLISFASAGTDTCRCRPSETIHGLSLPPSISITQTSAVSLLDFGQDRDDGNCVSSTYREFAASVGELEASDSAWAGTGFRGPPDLATFPGQHLYLGTTAHSLSTATVRSAPTRHVSPAISPAYELHPEPIGWTRPISATASETGSFLEKSHSPT